MRLGRAAAGKNPEGVEDSTHQRVLNGGGDLAESAVVAAAELEALLDQVRVAVVIVDQRCAIRRANPRAREILGATAAIGAHLGFDSFEPYLVNGRRVDRDAWPVSRALAGETVTRELLVFELPGAEAATLEITAGPVRSPDGNVVGAVVTFDDVSGRERRARAEREFVANAAHELRTPLTAIATAIEVLQSGAKEVPEDRDLFLGHIERECGRLSRLATALLSLARAQSQQEQPLTEVVGLAELLSRVAGDLRVARGVVVTVDCARDVAAVTNRDLAQQAVWNVAGNAARYTKHGAIEITGALAGSSAVIEIRDTGPGIPREERARLFDRFYRAGARDADGFGLGLAIAKQSLEAVGGTVTVESEPGEGTTARIELPAAKLL